jgi:hypothetical protein
LQRTPYKQVPAWWLKFLFFMKFRHFNKHNASRLLKNAMPTLMGIIFFKLPVLLLIFFGMISCKYLPGITENENKT